MSAEEEGRGGAAPARSSLLLHEGVSSTGELERTTLVLDGGVLGIDDGQGTAPLPQGALEAVFRRYGKPLEAPGAARITEPGQLRADTFLVAESLDLGDGRCVVRFRFRPRYDVIARDYLALFAPGEEALCELGTAIAAALRHLGRRRAG